MNKFFLFLVSVMFLTLGNSNAAVYKGQKVFVKKCVECHESGQSFIATKKIREWKKFMKKRGEALAEIHLKDENAKKSWSYFESRKYTKDSRDLEQFLEEYAKDSGNVPACN
ncbi:MAG: cytochrome C [Helicobacteraceae bacterium CG2_30_36_10]|nr:MAG: cytochrome C [Helicobacteraceae bacterium CG2_30_36_10]